MNTVTLHLDDRTMELLHNEVKKESVSAYIIRLVKATLASKKMSSPAISHVATDESEIQQIKQRLASISPRLASSITGKHYGDDLALDYKKDLAEIRAEKYL